MIARVTPWVVLGLVVVVPLGLWLRPDPAARSVGAGASTEGLAERLSRIERRLDELDSRAGRESPVGSEVAAVQREPVDRVRAPEDPGDGVGWRAAIAGLEGRVAALEAGVPSAEPAPDPAAIGLLNDALSQGRFEDARRLLDGGADPNGRDEDGRTPLAAASITGNLAMIDLLLARGADLERKAGRRSMTPLLAALDADQEDAALHILDRGGHPGAVDKNGESALIWASFNGLSRVAAALIDRGATVDFQCHAGVTALADAVRKGHVEIARLLLENGADPNLASKSGHTPLSRARKAENTELVELLRSFGAR